jgi:hypothetical protein
MSDLPPNPDLLRSLARLVRGLSALFWGLPAALVVCFGTVTAGWFKPFWILPPMAVTGLLLFGLWQLGALQRQERPWQTALDRARFFALLNCGFSPFLYWWNELPNNRFFGIIVGAFALSALVFLFELNLVLLRLGAMLPDETLRHETRQFTTLNRSLLTTLVFFSGVGLYCLRMSELPEQMSALFWLWLMRASLVLLIFLGLLPLAMTMALLWKAKEVILDSVFGGAER